MSVPTILCYCEIGIHNLSLDIQSNAKWHSYEQPKYIIRVYHKWRILAQHGSAVFLKYNFILGRKNTVENYSRLLSISPVNFESVNNGNLQNIVSFFFQEVFIAKCIFLPVQQGNQNRHLLPQFLLLVRWRYWLLLWIHQFEASD